MKRFMPTVEDFGGAPVAVHDMPCAVRWQSGDPAVLDISTGVFHPGWKAQEQGWRLVKATSFWQQACLVIGGMSR